MDLIEINNNEASVAKGSVVKGAFNSPPDGFCFSLNIDKILGAISQAQAKFPMIEKSESVDFTHNGRRTNYNYADLSKFVKAITPHLAENGLSVLHDCKTTQAGCSASTFIGHSSGQWIKSGAIVIRPSDAKPQTCGSALTYARRYSLTSFLELCSQEEDDDAAAAGGREPASDVLDLALVAQIMTTHGIHKEDRKKVVDWLVESKHSTLASDLEATIKLTAGKIKATKEKAAEEKAAKEKQEQDDKEASQEEVHNNDGPE